MINVSFKLGEVVNGWEVVNVVGGINEFVVRKDYITICFRTDAVKGTNYSKIMWYATDGRTYKAQRYLTKYVSLVQDFSNVLYGRFHAENEKNMDLFTKEDVEPINESTDLTHKWVVLAPKYMCLDWKPEYVKKRHQVVFVTGGFGCRGGAISMGGGKIFTNDTTGLQGFSHRCNVLGIAQPHVLFELDVPSTCPHCHKDSVLDALSRDNKTWICTDCGTREALSELGL